MPSNNFRYKLRGFRWPSVITIIIIIVVVAAWSWTGSNSFCGNICHADEAEYKAWQKSTHAKIDCLECHRAGGRFSIIGNKIFAIDKIIGTTYKAIKGQEAEVNPGSKLSDTISASICLQCHSLNRITPSKGIIIDHAKHSKKQINCTTCHNRIAHPNIKQYKDFMTMRGCYRCHGTDQNAVAMVKCGACHSEYFFPKTHRPLDFVSKKHVELAKEDPEYCTMCHTRQLCDDCHRIMHVGEKRKPGPQPGKKQ